MQLIRRLRIFIYECGARYMLRAVVVDAPGEKLRWPLSDGSDPVRFS